MSLNKGCFSLAHKHNASENSSNISTKHKNKHTCFSCVVLTRNHDKLFRSSCAYANAYVAMIPSENNIRKTSSCSSYASCLC